MDFRILGPLEVVDADRRVTVGAGKQRALLALLLLHANEVVPAERLIDELWRITRLTGAALVIGAIAAPAAPAISPDAVDGWPAAGETAASKVSPDTADMAAGHRIGATRVPEIVTVPVEVETAAPSGIDPSDVAIGAGATMGLVLIAAGGALTVARRRRPAGIA